MFFLIQTSIYQRNPAIQKPSMQKKLKWTRNLTLHFLSSIYLSVTIILNSSGKISVRSVQNKEYIKKYIASLRYTINPIDRPRE